MTALVMARFTFREAVRKRILYAALGLTVAFFVLYWLGCYFGFQDMKREGVLPTIQRFAAGQVLLAGLYVVNFMGGLLAIFVSAGTIASEIDQGTLHAVVPKPIHRWEIVVGKWLGLALMLSVYVASSSAIAMLIVYSLGGYLPPTPIQGIALSLLVVLLLLSLTMFFSTMLTTIASGIVVFMLYSVATVGGMIEQLGQLIRSDTMLNIGIATSLLIPSDVLWKMSAYLLRPPMPVNPSGVYGGGYGPFNVYTPPATPMIVYSLLYTAVALGLSLVAFRRRDL